MDALPLLTHAAAALGGASCVAAGCGWWLARGQKALQQRLAASEQARHAAVERSTQARSQISQLSKSLDELKQAQQARPRAQTMAPAEPIPAREIPSYEMPTLVLPRREPPQAFADTRPMQS